MQMFMRLDKANAIIKETERERKRLEGNRRELVEIVLINSITKYMVLFSFSL